jgi:hypothetical protein
MSWNRLFAAGLAALSLAASSARADQIAWSYSWEPSAMSLASDAGAGNILLTAESTKSASGDSDTVATNLHVSSSASSHTPEQFSHAAYSLSLSLTDAASHLSGTLTFTGFFTGTISASTSNLANTFTGELTQQLSLGNHVYTVTIDRYSAPGPPGATNGGSISAHVKANLQVDPPVHPSPEPTSLALAGLGLAGCAWGCRRRRKVRARTRRPA